MGSTVECGVFAPHLSGKLLVSLFSKSERVWAEPIKRRFLFAKLFLCASCAKEKACIMKFNIFKAQKTHSVNRIASDAVDGMSLRIL